MKRQQCLERGRGESDANLYPANWKQQSPAPEPQSTVPTAGLRPRPGRRGRVGDEGTEGGWRDGMGGLGSVSMASLFVGV